MFGLDDYQILLIGMGIGFVLGIGLVYYLFRRVYGSIEASIDRIFDREEKKK